MCEQEKVPKVHCRGMVMLFSPKNKGRGQSQGVVEALSVII